MTNKERLKELFHQARVRNHRYFAISTFAEGMKKPEVILFDQDDFEFKEAYLDNAYDDDLKLKRGPVHIVGMISGNQACAVLNSLLEGSKKK